jgi:hypothetical protein
VNEEDYKGFRCRQWNGILNIYYVCEDGEERCCGQTTNFHASVEGILRRPLPRWMTKKEEAWSPYTDHEHINSTCAHNVSLSEHCDTCMESYGEARVR